MFEIALYPLVLTAYLSYDYDYYKQSEKKIKWLCKDGGYLADSPYITVVAECGCMVTNRH